MLLPTAAADPVDAAAVPGTPGGSANELVLGRPLPLISLCRGQGCFFTIFSQATINYEYPAANNRGKTHREIALPLPPAVWLIAVARHLETDRSQCHLGDEVPRGCCSGLLPRISRMKTTTNLK